MHALPTVIRLGRLGDAGRPVPEVWAPRAHRVPARGPGGRPCVGDDLEGYPPGGGWAPGRRVRVVPVYSGGERPTRRGTHQVRGRHGASARGLGSGLGFG